jgi:hypothetical protein
MTLSEHQATFLRDIAFLILWASSGGVRIRAGQFGRSDEEQARLRAAGKSRVVRSKHQDRLAADLILDIKKDGRWVYQTETEAYEDLGKKWEALSEHNVWGGRWTGFPDGNHFERRIP